MLPPTREYGLKALANFLPRAGLGYASERNFSEATPGAVSRLSPYLQRRLLQEGEVARAAVAMHGFPAAEKFTQEVLWRTYWKGWLEQKPFVWTAYRNFPRQQSAELAKAEKGNTGIPCFDTWVEELRSTGYLHNHARMWFASIWIFTLGLPWQWGADFFWRELLDRDAASNTLSWRWVAGLQTKGKHYLATEENIAKFTRGRFSHTPGLRNGRAVPWDGLPEQSIEPLPTFAPLPQGDLALVIHGDDLSLELSEIATRPVRRIVVLSEAWCPASALVQAWSRAALEDAAARAEAHFGVRVEWLEPGKENAPAALAQFGADLPLIQAAPFVGPWKDLGWPAFSFRRAHDSLLFPHAQKGFFSFRSQIIPYLQTAGVNEEKGNLNPRFSPC